MVTCMPWGYAELKVHKYKLQTGPNYYRKVLEQNKKSNQVPGSRGDGLVLGGAGGSTGACRRRSRCLPAQEQVLGGRDKVRALGGAGASARRPWRGAEESQGGGAVARCGGGAGRRGRGEVRRRSSAAVARCRGGARSSAALVSGAARGVDSDAGWGARRLRRCEEAAAAPVRGGGGGAGAGRGGAGARRLRWCGTRRRGGDGGGARTEAEEQ